MSERREVECMLKEQRDSDGDTVEGHSYRITESHDNCHVDVMTCEVCGHVSVGWHRMDQPPARIGEGDPMPEFCKKCGNRPHQGPCK